MQTHKLANYATRKRKGSKDQQQFVFGDLFMKKRDQIHCYRHSQDTCLLSDSDTTCQIHILRHDLICSNVTHEGIIQYGVIS